jgi:hypothetical protein
MSRRPSILIASLLTMLMLPLAAPAMAAPPSAAPIVSETATYDAGTGEVTFGVVFSHKPDFYGADAYQRPATSFQYFVGGDPNAYGFDAVIRGDEIRSSGGLVVVRDGSPADDGTAESGGWGPIRSAVAYSLRGHKMQFSVPLSVLTDQTEAGVVPYILESYEYGGLISRIEGTISLS